MFNYAPSCSRCRHGEGHRTSAPPSDGQAEYHCNACGYVFRAALRANPALNPNDAYSYLRDELSLPRGVAQSIMRQIKQQDAAARKAGTVRGGVGWDIAALETAVQDYRAAKCQRHANQLAYSAALAAATAHPEAHPALVSLMAELNRQSAALEAVIAERHTFGVPFAERNLAARGAALRRDIRGLKERITAAGYALNPSAAPLQA